MTEIYFDNSATTRPYPSVVDIVVKTMTDDYGNPSSMHQKGVDAERYLKETSRILSDILKVQEKEIYYTSGGTESDNWAIIGSALAKRRAGMHVVTTQVEHPAVSEAFRYLEEQGFTVSRIGVDENGRIRLDELGDALTAQTVLVSVMAVNNEIGTVMPLKEIRTLMRKKSPQALFHVDATQAFGHFRIYPKEIGIDLLAASAHKFHGPKGVGFLYADSAVRLLPLIVGGGQQKGMRSGTDNVPGIAGMGEAARESYRDLEEKQAYLSGLRDYFIARTAELPDVRIHTPEGDAAAPHIVNVSFTGVGSEVLLHALEDRGIYISAGSACSTHKRSKSPTLTAMEIPEKEIGSSVRFSFDISNTREEIDAAVKALAGLLPLLRRYRAR